MIINKDEVLFTMFLIIGGVYIITGILFFLFPPKNMNWFYGYRTFSSMKSKERWKFAQTYSARELTRWGFVMVISSPFGFLIPSNKVIELILSLVVVFGALFLVFYRTEKALKKKFAN